MYLSNLITNHNFYFTCICVVYIHPKAHFPSEIPVSDASKDLLSRLLTSDSGQRLTAAEALNHPWLAGAASQRSMIDPRVVKAISTFDVKCKFQQAVLHLMVDCLSDVSLQQLQSSFAAMDSNGDGFVSIQDLRRVMKQFYVEQQARDEITGAPIAAIAATTATAAATAAAVAAAANSGLKSTGSAVVAPTATTAGGAVKPKTDGAGAADSNSNKVHRDNSGDANDGDDKRDGDGDGDGDDNGDNDSETTSDAGAAATEDLVESDAFWEREVQVRYIFITQDIYS